MGRSGPHHMLWKFRLLCPRRGFAFQIANFLVSFRLRPLATCLRPLAKNYKRNALIRYCLSIAVYPDLSVATSNARQGGVTIVA